ncbi:MAG: acetylornithine deacetylase [Burkholderiales bacterium]
MNARDHARAAGPRAEDLAAWPMLGTLVGFDTTSRESNLGLIEWVRDWLAARGVVSALTFDDERRKANLFATIPARDGNRTAGGIVLSGHTDVVPVDGQSWSTDPFVATPIGDRIQGRGVCDMKGFIATALALVPEFLARDLARPLHLALSYDEEVGCLGVRRLIDDLAARAIRPSGCIVGEPTSMRPVVAHKGKRSWRCRVHGREAHSSLTPRGVNAVEAACRLVTHLSDLAQRYRDDGPRDRAYDVPYTTVHVGTIRGGTALNIVPREATFDFEVRHLPSDDPETVLASARERADALLPAMRAVAAEAGIAFERLSVMPGFDTPGDTEIVALARVLAGENCEPGKVSFGSEASRFCAASIPSVVCGPGGIDQAHQPDEWVSIEQLGRCEVFVRRLADRLRDEGR